MPIPLIGLSPTEYYVTPALCGWYLPSYGNQIYSREEFFESLVLHPRLVVSDVHLAFLCYLSS